MDKYVKRKVIWWLETFVKLGILTVGFLEASSITFGKPIISYALWPTVILGAFLLMVRMINYKHYWKTKNFWLLFAFCVSYLLSIVMNIQYGWYNNIRTLCWMALLFFLIYCYHDEDPVERSQKQFSILAGYYLVITALLSISSFVFMITGYAKVFYQEVGPIYYIGFHWGRLYGSYWDANIGALMGCVSIILSLGFCQRIRSKILKIILTANIVLEIFYIAFSDSRTGILCLCIALPIYVFLLMLNKKKNLAIVYAICALLLALFVPTGIKKCYNTIISSNYNYEHTENLGSTSEMLENKGTQSDIVGESQAVNIDNSGIGREDEYAGDISNRRFDIWKGAIQLFLTSPIWGVSHNNVLPYVEAQIPDSYLVTNDHMKFESMHNGFLDILVAQGILGIGIYFILIVITVKYILQNWKKISNKDKPAFICCFSIVAAVFAATLVMSEIVYVTSPMSTMFWIALGVMVKTISSNEKSFNDKRGMVK